MVVPTQGWVSCPRGELGRLSTRLRLRRLVKLAVVVAALVTASVVTATAVQVAADGSPAWLWSDHSGSGCSSCGCATDDAQGAAHK